MSNQALEIELDTLYSILVDGQLMNSDANFFHIVLWDSHDMFDSYEDAEQALNKLRNDGHIGEDDGKVVSINFSASIE